MLATATSTITISPMTVFEAPTLSPTATKFAPPPIHDPQRAASPFQASACISDGMSQPAIA